MGLKKVDAAKELGVEVVQAWRNSLKARPPPMKVEDEHYPGKDRRYEDLGEGNIPMTESLMDCMERGEAWLCCVFGVWIGVLTVSLIDSQPDLFGSKSSRRKSKREIMFWLWPILILRVG